MQSDCLFSVKKVNWVEVTKTRSTSTSHNYNLGRKSYLIYSVTILSCEFKFETCWIGDPSSYTKCV